MLTFVGDSDAHIVRGLIAMLFALYSGKDAQDILVARCRSRLFEKLGLREHLTPQRSNGLRSMVKRIRARRQYRADGRGLTPRFRRLKYYRPRRTMAEGRVDGLRIVQGRHGVGRPRRRAMRVRPLRQQ